MRLRLALASLVFLALSAGPTAVGAQQPQAGPDVIEAPGDPPPGTPDQVDSEEGEEEIELLDVRELKPVAPKPKPAVDKKTAKKPKPETTKKPKKGKVKGDAACDFRMPVYTHEVIDGDMLSSIAARYGVRVGDIKKLN